MTNTYRWMAIAAAVAMIAVGCSSDGEVTATSDSTSPTSTVDDAALAASTPTTSEAPPATTPDYSAEAALAPQAANDASLPDVLPDSSVGAYGFSRYVYQDQAGEVVPTLIEGPQGRQVRCQQLDRDCSYTELEALYESGEELPDYLEMDRETLGALLDQLARVNAAVNQYEDLDAACAAGMAVSSTQNANMGIHVVDPGAGSEFNPDRPQMILFAKDGGEFIPRSELGRCEDGAFSGEDGFRPVGAVFNIAMSDEHPEAFAGDLDNWHLHLNTCGGSELENVDVIEPEEAEAGVPMSREECEASGGFFIPIVSSWMMHAYVVPEHDPQGGVFSMYNPNIWPLADSPEQLREQKTVNANEGVVPAPIVNFDYGDINADVGEPIVFANADSVPHTVTSGSALDPTSDFDSGVLGTGQSFELAFDAPGEYPLFCVLHPEMQATVSVG
ncbi:MAG: cupredoxin domain-containing protein [Acidimicrobiales bacterium]